MKKALLIAFVLGATIQLPAQKDLAELRAAVIEASDKIESKCIAWRRDIHEHPELGNREFRTAKIVSTHLKKLGLDVKENVAKTGVVGILKGGKPGPVIALRADM